MYFAQIEPDGTIAGVINPVEAYPGNGWAIIRPLMEKQGWVFVELEKNELPGDIYNVESGEWEKIPPEVPEPELPDLGVATLEGVAALSEQITALTADIEAAKTDAAVAKNASLAALEGIAALAESSMDEQK